jgi:hypothetical protein
MPFLCPSPLYQDGGTKAWAEPGSLEDSCPSYAQARPTKIGVVDEVRVVGGWEPFDGCWLVLLQLVADDPNPPSTCSR